MTDKELIDLAEKAGFPQWWINPQEPERQNGEALLLLKRFASLVSDVERERCAKLCDAYFEWSARWALDDNQVVANKAAEECAAEIRRMK